MVSSIMWSESYDKDAAENFYSDLTSANVVPCLTETAVNFKMSLKILERKITIEDEASNLKASGAPRYLRQLPKFKYSLRTFVSNA